MFVGGGFEQIKAKCPTSQNLNYCSLCNLKINVLAAWSFRLLSCCEILRAIPIRIVVTLDMPNASCSTGRNAFVWLEVQV